MPATRIPNVVGVAFSENDDKEHHLSIVNVQDFRLQHSSSNSQTQRYLHPHRRNHLPDSNLLRVIAKSFISPRRFNSHYYHIFARLRYSINPLRT